MPGDNPSVPCPRCGGTRVLPLTYGSGQTADTEPDIRGRPRLKCAECGRRIVTTWVEDVADPPL